MRISKFIKLEKNILLEYIYDDDNNISERYKILKNIKDGSYTYISNSTSNINNINNQLIDMDLLSYKSSNCFPILFRTFNDFNNCVGLELEAGCCSSPIPISFSS